MKKIVCFLSVIILSLCFSNVARAESGVEVNNPSGVKNEVVYLSVSVTELSSVDAVGVYFDYDRTKLDFMKSKSYWNRAGVLSDIDPIDCSAVWAATEAVDLEGEILVLAFRILTEEDTQISIPLSIICKNNAEDRGSFQATSFVTAGCAHSFTSLQDTDGIHHGKTCTKCGNVQVALHEFGDPVVVTKETTEEEGLYRYICDVCHFVKEITIPKVVEKDVTDGTKEENQRPSGSIIVNPNEGHWQQGSNYVDPSLNAGDLQQQQWEQYQKELQLQQQIQQEQQLQHELEQQEQLLHEQEMMQWQQQEEQRRLQQQLEMLRQEQQLQQEQQSSDSNQMFSSADELNQYYRRQEIAKLDPHYELDENGDLQYHEELTEEDKKRLEELIAWEEDKKQSEETTGADNSQENTNEVVASNGTVEGSVAETKKTSSIIYVAIASILTLGAGGGIAGVVVTKKSKIKKSKKK